MESNERLKQIRRAAGYRYAKEAARAFGWNENTYSSHENGNRGIPIKAAKTYAARFKVSLDWLLEGKGAGPTDLAPDGVPNARPRKTAPQDSTPIADLHIPLITELPKDLPVMGTGAGSNSGAFLLKTGSPIDYVRRPPGVSNRKDVFGIYVEGDSMEPKFEPGDLLICDPHRPARITEYVVVVVQLDESGDEEAYVGRLLAKRGGNVSIEKLNPSSVLELQHVSQVLKIITMNELFGV